MRDLDFFRTLLREQRSDALSSVAELGGAIEAIVSARQDSNSDDEHDPEGVTLAFERSQSDALLRQTVQRLRDIDASLARLEAGTYGRCEVCGEPIRLAPDVRAPVLLGAGPQSPGTAVRMASSPATDSSDGRSMDSSRWMASASGTRSSERRQRA